MSHRGTLFRLNDIKGLGFWRSGFVKNREGLGAFRKTRIRRYLATAERGGSHGFGLLSFLQNRLMNVPYGTFIGFLPKRLKAVGQEAWGQ
jgi:hypothetical protein